MTPDSETVTPALPALRKLFDELKSGRHWSFGDDAYPELSGENFPHYAQFFSQIGIKLESDPRGFYFATLDKDDDSMIANKTATSFILFAAIWIEAIADRGLNIHAEIFQKEHRPDQLPHFSAENHRRLMTEAGMASPDDLERLLGALNRMGFINLLTSGAFQVRAPFHRLLDVCQEYGKPTVKPGDKIAESVAAADQEVTDNEEAGS
jgi:hypothetical protein